MFEGCKCSSDEWQHGRMIQKNIWSKARISIDNTIGHSERKKKEADIKKVGRQYLKSGQESTLPAQLGQLIVEKVKRIVANSSVVLRRPSKVMG